MTDKLVPVTITARQMFGAADPTSQTLSALIAHPCAHLKTARVFIGLDSRRLRLFLEMTHGTLLALTDVA